MKSSQFERQWEEAEMDLRLLEAELQRLGVTVAKVRNVHEGIYEGLMGMPAPRRRPVGKRVAS